MKAVILFFELSGFIFFWLYSERVATRSISSTKFALLRFSRLYPLHLLTLLLVLAGQAFVWSHQGDFFVYPYNDLKHFVLNLLFASSWGLEEGYSFNGPMWSVSIEVLLYALFYIYCRLLPVRLLFLAALSFVGFVLVEDHLNAMIGKGIGAFFLGGSVYLVYKSLVTSRHIRRVTYWVTGMTLAAWAAVLVFVYTPVGAIITNGHYSVPVLWKLGVSVNSLLLGTFPVLVLFPLTIFSLAFIESARGTLGRRIAFIGDISYSSYLLHFPLQLFTVIILSSLGVGEDLFYSPGFMVLFFTILIVLCLASYRYFEMPAQRLLRRVRAY